MRGGVIDSERLHEIQKGGAPKPVHPEVGQPAKETQQVPADFVAPLAADQPNSESTRLIRRLSGSRMELNC
jgi:hypothetical protein